MLLITVILAMITIVLYFNAIEKNNELNKIINQTYSQKFNDEFKQILDQAQAYAETHYIPKAAIVFDIDETLLDNRQFYKIYPAYNKKNWDQWINKSCSGPIVSTIDFLKWAKFKGYKIILITGRYQYQRKATIENLNKHNIPFDALYLKPNNYDKSTVSIFKTSIRKKIEDSGYKVIINLGDQYSDLMGDYGKDFKLPNPIYTIP